MRETELKYRLSGPDEQDRLRERLRALGALHVSTDDEANVLFDRPGGRFRRADTVLRLRTVDSRPSGTLTYKGPAERRGGLKSRQEVEVAVGDAKQAAALLRALGYREAVAYRKRRERWRLLGVEVALDTLEVGCFCELEGPAEALGALAKQLGLDPAGVEPATYPELLGWR
jgi:adenylate cyclase class 2